MSAKGTISASLFTSTKKGWSGAVGSGCPFVS